MIATERGQPQRGDRVGEVDDEVDERRRRRSTPRAAPHMSRVDT